MNRKAFRVLVLALFLCLAGSVILKKNGLFPKEYQEAANQQKIRQTLSSERAESETKTEAEAEMESKAEKESRTGEEEKAKVIQWVDFQVSYEALCEAYEACLKNPDLDWIDLLAITAAKSGGTFGKKEVSQIGQLAAQLTEKQTTLQQETEGLKYYAYYKEAYEAVLAGYVGSYIFEETDENGAVTEKKGYGLKAFSPIAAGFPYSDYDDFGVSRTYGFKRRHLGHDMMGQIGTPIIAVESGTVECLGWNRYGGWRIGIRSFDKKRYYYYAHLRQNYPYAEGLAQGMTVAAGQVIGYMGHTGYSTKENVNNIDEPHLHFGIQLIFDESQKDGDHEIWIDCYALVRFLKKNQSRTVRAEQGREWISLKTLKE